MTRGGVVFLKTLEESSLTRVANDHDRDQIFGLDYLIPTDSNQFQPIIGTMDTYRSTTPTRILKSIMISESSNWSGRRSLASLLQC